MPLARPHVVRVTSNVKGGVSATLTEKTLIVGPNGEGKSAIVNALTLALTGAADDLLGRDVVKLADVIGLMAPPGENVTASATLSNGVESTYLSVRKADGGFGNAKLSNTFPGAVPLRDVRESLTGSAEKARAFLLSRAAGQITADDVLRVIPEARREDYAAAVIAAGAKGLAPVDQLLAVIDSTKGEANEAKKRAKVLNEQVAARGNDLPAEPLDADVAEAEAIVSTAEAAFVAALTVAGAAIRDAAGVAMLRERCAQQAQNVALRQRNVAQLRDEATRAIAAFTQGKADLAALDAALPADVASETARAALWQAVSVITSRAVVNLDKLNQPEGVCPCCHSAASRGAFFAAGEAAVGVLAKLNDLTTRAATRDRMAQALPNTKAAALRVVETLERAEEALRATEAALARDTATAQAAQSTASVGLSDPEAARFALAAAQGRKGAYIGVRAAWAELRATKAAVEATLAQEAAARGVCDAASSVVETLLDGAAAAFVARVNLHLPTAYRFGLQLRDGEKAVCRYGFVQANGGLHAAVSGAEWALLTAALTLACVGDGPGPVVLVPDERAFDPDTLRAALVALADAPVQVVITSPIRPSGRLPAGWSIVEVGGEGSSTPKPRGRPRKVEPTADTLATPSVAPLGNETAPELATPPISLTAPLGADADDDPFERVVRALAGAK